MEQDIDKIKADYDDLCGILYRHRAVGGYLHIVTDDGNIEDGHIDFCMNEIQKNEDNYPYHLLLVCTAILELLLQYPEGSAERFYLYCSIWEEE